MLWQDFDGNHHLKNLTIEFLEDILCTRTLLPAEHKAASQLLRSRAGLSVMKIALINDIKCIFGLNIIYFFSRMLTKEEPAYNIINLEEILAPSTVRFHSKKYFSTMFLSLLKF